MASTNFTCRIDNSVKAQSEAVYNELGMNLTTAINVFLRESIRVGGFPFDVRLNSPNKETIAAMVEAEGLAHDNTVKKYDVEEALAELKR
ncbi:type II toxin-antitoxin system RelB/DinJ family antitoxin [Anaerovibrio lipolyticus]|uniref:type II toxin-antitoxin system RelB/DinJ family antitoxin n=1 Tax=Anaerovibrio lipolyticus TaxID=82374 RepID=UPI00048681C7|nr:type II toxin-antitoxin system RelB/DinJ family antitoxin [Anaerovibrio lipolyticus]